MTEEVKTRVVIGRFELYPHDKPTDYLVGFKIFCDYNGLERYAEVRFPIHKAEGLEPHEICTAAWRFERPKLNEIISKLVAVPRVIGADFIPPEDE